MTRRRLYWVRELPCGGSIRPLHVWVRPVNVVAFDHHGVSCTRAILSECLSSSTLGNVASFLEVSDASIALTISLCVNETSDDGRSNDMIQRALALLEFDILRYYLG